MKKDELAQLRDKYSREFTDESKKLCFVTGWNTALFHNAPALSEPVNVNQEMLEALNNLVLLAEHAMNQANRDGCAFEIENELKEARDVISRAEKGGE